MGVRKSGELPHGNIGGHEANIMELTAVRPQKLCCFPDFRGIRDIQGPINRRETQPKIRAAFEIATDRIARELRIMNNRQTTHCCQPITTGTAQNRAVLSNQAFETLLEAVL